MNEQDFWPTLERRVCDELRDNGDSAARFMWCDGVRGTLVRAAPELAYLAGTIWIEGRGSSEMRFTMTLPADYSEPDPLPWDAMLPARSVTGWLSIDLKTKHVTIDASRSVERTSQQTLVSIVLDD